MNQADGNQMVIHGQTALKMTEHPAVILGLLTIQGTNLGTFGPHNHQLSFAQKFSKSESIIDELGAWSWENHPPPLNCLREGAL
tara:strand:+ start:77 stop:328 length:252 start_codon:yes stop_codon:yes gene_type:complete